MKVQQARSVGVRPRVLVVDDEPELLEMVADTISDTVGCKLLPAATLTAARRIIESQRVDLLIADRRLPDGDGLSLLGVLSLHQPTAQAIVMTGHASVDGAVEAIREGASDLLSKPFSATELAERVRRALTRCDESAKREKRLDRLRDAVKRLNDARKMVSKKVDLLCNDLITAYGELSKQLDLVRVQEGFRHVLRQAKDLEQLLCHSMDWLLRQLGYANIAVWLAGEDEQFQLGAYMKYTIPGEQALTDAMAGGIVKHSLTGNLIRLSGESLKQQLSARELEYLTGQDLIAVNCTYLAESLAVIVLFRDARTPFKDEDEAMLKTISPLLALSLAAIVRGHETEGDAFEGEQGGLLDENNTDQPPRKKKKDEADWWKRGEEPPY